MFCLAIGEALPAPMLVPVVWSVVVFVWAVEFGRQRSATVQRWTLQVVGAMVHPSERKQVISGTWYISAVGLLVLVVDIEFIAIAMAAVGFGDPAAGLVGRRWGRTRLLANRSLEGSVAYVVAGTIAAVVVLQIWHAPARWTPALAGAVAAALAELGSGGRLDDNLTAPLAAAGAAWWVVSA